MWDLFTWLVQAEYVGKLFTWLLQAEYVGTFHLASTGGVCTHLFTWPVQAEYVGNFSLGFIWLSLK